MTMAVPGFIRNFTPANKSVIMKKKKIILATLAAVIVLFLTATVGGSLYLLDFALTPDAKIHEKDLKTDSFMIANYPFLKPWMDSLDQHKALKDTFILNKEGIRLHALYLYAPRKTDKTAVVVHGHTDNARRMLMIGYLYNHDLGYNVLLPDLRHQGLSAGDAIGMGWKDRLDVLQWMNAANSLFGGNTRMVVHGISMGAATTMMVSGEKPQFFVKCFVEDCGYTSVKDEFSHELKEMFGLPDFPVLPVASMLCDMKYGWNFDEASALSQVRKCYLPMLFIHGGSDTYVPTHMVYPLYQDKPGIKEIWIPRGVEHAESYKDCRKEYTEKVRNFTSKYI